MWILKLWGWALAPEYVHNVLIMSASQWSINAIIACAFFSLFNRIWHMKNLDSCCYGETKNSSKSHEAFFHYISNTLSLTSFHDLDVATCRRSEKGSSGVESTLTGKFSLCNKTVLITLSLRLRYPSVRYLLYIFLATTFRILMFSICISMYMH